LLPLLVLLLLSAAAEVSAELAVLLLGVMLQLNVAV
jgi:hypothetical protein